MVSVYLNNKTKIECNGFAIMKYLEKVVEI